MLASRCTVGLDLGTSGLKGVVADEDGVLLAAASAGYPTYRPVSGAAEQDPREWIRATESVVRQLATEVAPSAWRGIGLSGMIPSLVVLDTQGEPVAPAVTWEDNRADELGTELRSAFDGEALYRATGQWVDGRYLLPMLLRLLREDPEVVRKAVIACSAKDYLFEQLTGEVLTDPSTAAGYGCYGLEAGSWLAGVLAAAGRLSPAPLPRLPRVCAATLSLPISPAWAERLGLQSQLPIVLGAADSVLGAEGLGIREPGQVAYIAGTSTVILGISDALRFDPAHRYLVTPMARPGMWGWEMDLLATGSAIGWLGRMLSDADPVASTVALAEAVAPEDAPVFLPFLAGGEQGALWDPNLHAAVVGLQLHHERGHLVRGLLNGIVVESRRCLSVLEEAGLARSALHVAGTSASWPTFGTDLADASGWTVVTCSPGEANQSALGAAMLSAEVVDGVRSQSSAQPFRAGSRQAPSRERAANWEDIAGRHDAAVTALRIYFDGRTG